MQDTADKLTSIGDSPGNWAWARARQLEGTLGGDPMLGVWPITHNRVIRGWGDVRLSQLTHGALSWPADNPAALDELAKRERIGLYYRIWTSKDVLKAVSRQHSVSASFRITDKWRHPPEGRLDFEQAKNDIVGGHLLRVGPPLLNMPRPKSWLDDDYFVHGNSWGEDWGNRGYYAMRYDFFDREMYEAWAIVPRLELPALYGNGIQHIRWEPGGDHDLHCYANDIVDVESDNRLAWAIVVLRRGELNVEDLYVKPEARGKGYGNTMIRALSELSAELSVPLRFWIPFADVEHAEAISKIRGFFSKYGFGFESSPRQSAAFCAIRGGSSDIPSFQLPPKPSYVFVEQQQPTVNWDELQQRFRVSDEFAEQAKSVFDRHSEALRRLA